MLTVDDFVALAGERFELRTGIGSGVGAQPVALQADLVDVKPLPAGAAAARQPFSLLFRGPSEPLLPQGIYRIDHASLGTAELFLVPVQADGTAVSYEAVFG